MPRKKRVQVSQKPFSEEARRQLLLRQLSVKTGAQLEKRFFRLQRLLRQKRSDETGLKQTLDADPTGPIKDIRAEYALRRNANQKILAEMTLIQKRLEQLGHWPKITP